ncbi:MAG: CcmD family protein [Dehalococcoidia bacterium]|nr:CcmD family protein [Dehalococcoidia bacterium]
MDYLEFMFAGFAVFWAGLFVYLLMLQMRIRSLQQEVERLEERLAEQEAGDRRTTEARPVAGGRPAAPATRQSPAPRT